DQFGPSVSSVPKIAKQLTAKKNQERVKYILLLAIPDEYLLRFHNVPDAKSLWKAIKSRFGGNEESKKMQKNVLKYKFENFTTAPNETLDKAYDRFQKLISQLEVYAAPVSKEDINQKFLRSLPPSWSQIALIMRNKPDIDQTDIDDLYNNLSRTNEVSTASGNFGVNTAGGTNSSSHVSSTPGADEVVCSFFAQQTTSPPLDNEDLQQIDQDDLEKLDIRWQVAMLTVRVQRFIKKIGRNLDFKGKQLVTFDKSQVECYNCHRKWHFAKECKSGWNQGKRSNGDNGRRNETNNEPLSQALVAQDGLGGYDWSNDFDEPVNYALIAISSLSLSSSSDNEVQNCSKQCLESFKTLQKNYDSEREKHNRARLEIQGYELALESLESRILGHEKNELAWVALKRKTKKVIVSDSEDEETENQGRKIQDINDDPLVSLVRESMKEQDIDFVTPTKISASGEVQEQDISPTTLEAAKTLSQVISQKAKSTDKGIRYKRKTRSKLIEKDISTDLDVDIEVNPGSEDFNTSNEDFNTGSLGVSTGSGPVSTPSVVQTINVTIPSPIKSQREGKAPMTTEEIQATKRTKAQIQQEEAGLAEAMRLQALQEEEAARQVHLDALLAKRISEEEELSEQQKKRKAEVQEAAQYYTEEDWDTIRAKLEANAELTKSLQGESMTSEDFAKRMVEMINQKKKFYAEQKAKARRSKPMTQAQQRDYMSTFIKNQSSWKLTQLKKLTFDELKTEFEKLVKSIENFVPMETDERVKRQGVQLEQEFSKKQKTIEEVSVLEESITEPVIAKEEEIEKSVKKRGKIRKQKARKGIHIDKTAQDESEEEREAFMKDKVTSASSESEIGIDAIPTATKPPSIVDWKIIPQSGLKAVYQIIRRDGSDKIYMSFGAILKDFSRDDLTELVTDW
ncbi:ribonuclease H-like domain-containing protein, partial [Tanacetum coccineum]